MFCALRSSATRAPSCAKKDSTLAVRTYNQDSNPAQVDSGDELYTYTICERGAVRFTTQGPLPNGNCS